MTQRVFQYGNIPSLVHVKEYSYFFQSCQNQGITHVHSNGYKSDCKSVKVLFLFSVFEKQRDSYALFSFIALPTRESRTQFLRTLTFVYNTGKISHSTNSKLS